MRLERLDHSAGRGRNLPERVLIDLSGEDRALKCRAK
jgi:hypothetical protein